MRKKKVNSDGTLPQLQTFATGSGLNSRGQSGTLNAQIVCLVCSTVNFLKDYHMKRKRRLYNEVDFVTSV